METKIYIATDSRLPRASVKWYGYVLECTQGGSTWTKEGFGTVTGTYHKATLAALADALQRFRRPCEIHIYTEDSFALNMLGRNLAPWAGNGFLSSRGEPVANGAEWKRVWEESRGHTLVAEPGPHAYGGWIRGEIGRKKREQEEKKGTGPRAARTGEATGPENQHKGDRKEQDNV